MHIRRQNIFLVSLILILILSSACNNSLPSSSQNNPTSTAQPSESLNADQLASEVKSPIVKQTPAANKELPKTIVHSVVPGNPSAPEVTKEEINTSRTADKKLALGDSFRLGIFERPFTADTMEYQPETDLLETSISTDDNFYYFLLKVDGDAPGVNFPNAHYGVEFDTNFDGRGDILLWAQGNGSPDWVIDDVTVLEDTNGDVGGAYPVIADSSSGNGYDKVLFSSDLPDDPDSAWQRFADNQVELAVKKDLIGASSFFWKVWADNGLADPALFDYNDAFTAQQAGSPACGSSSDYPVKDLNQMDSTCWIAFNHHTTGYELGGCDKPQPTAVPLKHHAAVEPEPACPPCGTYLMSYDCCAACGSAYVWDGTGCRAAPSK